MPPKAEGSGDSAGGASGVASEMATPKEEKLEEQDPNENSERCLGGPNVK